MSVTTPTLDVVIPCYNEEGDIAECLERLLAQADQIERIIVVDNNSTDTTAAIIKKYQAAHDKIVYLVEPQQGVQHARNAGFAAASSDILARIDADTRVMPDWAKRIREYYGAHPDAQVATGATEYYDLPARKITNFMTWFFMYASNKLVGGSIGLYGANMSIRRKAWADIKQYVKMNPEIMEDLSISLALQRSGYRVVYVREAFARVSGRRIRTNPKHFAAYNEKWWRTYQVYGQRFQARAVRVFSLFGNLLQAPTAWLLQFHDPKTGTFHAKKVSHYEERILP